MPDTAPADLRVVPVHAVHRMYIGPVCVVRHVVCTVHDGEHGEAVITPACYRAEECPVCRAREKES